MKKIKQKQLSSEIGMSQADQKQYNFMNVVRALITGDRERAPFEHECSKAVERKTGQSARGYLVPRDMVDYLLTRAMNAETAPAGGYLVKTHTGQTVALLRNNTVVKEVGATELRDLDGDVLLPKQSGASTAYWLGESDDATESEPTVGQIRLTPKTVAAYTEITRRLEKQTGPDASAFVLNDLIATRNVATDLAAISGDGVNEPLGILNTDGIGSVTLDAVNTPDWGDIVDLEAAVAADNALLGTLAYVTNATICSKMKQTEKVSNTAKFLFEDGKANGYSCHISNQVPSGHILFGNWADLIIGYWGAMDVNIDTASLSKSGGKRIVVMQDVDVAVRHPESFADGYKA